MRCAQPQCSDKLIVSQHMSAVSRCPGCSLAGGDALKDLLYKGHPQRNIKLVSYFWRHLSPHTYVIWSCVKPNSFVSSSVLPAYCLIWSLGTSQPNLKGGHVWGTVLHLAPEAVKQASGIVCYTFRHTKYRKLWKICWIPVVVVKGHVFVKSMLGWIYLQREVFHAHEVGFFFLYRHKVCILNFVFGCAPVS